jgi:hypothetical protein
MKIVAYVTLTTLLLMMLILGYILLTVNKIEAKAKEKYNFNYISLYENGSLFVIHYQSDNPNAAFESLIWETYPNFGIRLRTSKIVNSNDIIFSR